ncbi:hypothetical protein D9M71_18690 [compost metagenome]
MTLPEQIKQAYFDYIDQNHSVPNYLSVSANIHKSLLSEQSDFIKTIPMDTGMVDMKFLGYEVGVSTRDDTPFTWEMN